MDADTETLCNTVGVVACPCGHVHLSMIGINGQLIRASLDAGEALQIAKALSDAALKITADAMPALVLQ